MKRGWNFSLLILFIVVLSVSVYLFVRIPHGQDVFFQDTPRQSGVLSVKEVQHINLKVNKMLDYGEGPRVEGRNPTEKEILAAGKGHCGMYAYLLCKELLRHGVEGIAYDLRTSPYGNPAASHTVVEVQTEEGRRVFDPTYGIFYHNDLDHLLTCENVPDYRGGIPSDKDSYYLTDRFWSEVVQIVRYTNVCNVYDLNLLRWTMAMSSANLPQTALEAISSIKIDESLEKNSIMTTFHNDEDFYRIEVGFKERLSEPFLAECRIMDSQGNIVTVSGRLHKKSYSIEFQLDEAVTGQSVQISFQSETQQLPPLAYYNVYQ